MTNADTGEVDKRTPAEVGELLRQLRERRHLTQEQIPRVSSATVGKLERGVTGSFRRTTLLAYLDAVGAVPEAYDWLGAGAPLHEVMTENHDPEIQIAAAAGKLPPQDQAEVMAFIRDKLAAHEQK